MARKLLIFLALISLVLLTQARPGSAATYDLEGGGAYQGGITWTEIHGLGDTNEKEPGNANGEFLGGFDPEWEIAHLTNPVAGEVIAETSERITYEITYNSLLGDGIGGPGDSTRFVVNTSEINLSSSDLVLIATAEYDKEKDSGGHWKCWGETIYGYGTDGDGTSFSFNGNLVETQGDSVHYGYITEFTLVHPASTVPIPGAVWLFGTGALGLFCLGWRRK